MKHYWSALGVKKYHLKHDCQVLECEELSEEDIIEMQTIDADCNDCKHFKRGKFYRDPGLDWFEGHCMKFDRPTKAYPNQFTGWECFEHRRR